MSQTPSPKSAKKRRTWKQRTKITILVILIAIGLFRILLNLLLPTVVRKVANAYGLDCAYGSMSLSVLGGNADIWDLVLRPKTGGDSIVQAEYVHGIISPLNLLRGRLIVYRVEVDGVDMLIDRQPDGSIPLLAKVLSPTNSPAAKPAPASGAVPGQVDLQAPLRVDAVRLSHVTTKFRDGSVTPVFETTVRTNVRISDVGSDTNPTKFELDIGADPILDDLIVDGEAHNNANSLDADLHVLLRGLHPKPAAGYLMPLGLKPVADNITVRANLKLTANVIPNTPDISANFALADISATVDDQEWASLAKLNIDAKKLSAAGAEFGKLVIENGDASARRAEDGGLRIAGLELIPPAPAPPTPASAGTSAPIVFPVSVDEISLKDLRAAFGDQSVSPAVALLARLDDLSVKNIVIDSSKPDAKTTIDGSFSIPGVIRSIRVTGSATPSAAIKHLSLAITGEGVKPDAITTYLKQAGLESQFKNGTFAADIDATVSTDAGGLMFADAAITEIHLDDGSPLLAFDSAKISKLALNPVGGGIRVADIELSGPTLDLHRDRAGLLAAAGFRMLPPAEHTAAPASTKPAAPMNFALFALPAIQIDQFSWKNIRMNLDDQSSSPATSVALGDSGVEASNLLIDLGPAPPTLPAGKFHAWFSLPKVIDRLDAQGTLTSQPHQLVVESDVTGRNITGEALAPYLKPLGLVPTLKSGGLTLKSRVRLWEIEGGIGAALDLANVQFTDGQTQLAGVDGVRLSDLSLTNDQLDAGNITINHPHASITRNADGTFEAGGIRLVPIVSNDPPAPSMPLHLSPLPIKAKLGHLRVNDGEIAWTDSAANPPVQTKVAASVDLGDARVELPGAPATLKVAGLVDGVVDRFTVDGTLALSPDAPSAQLNIVAEGVRTGPLASYLPPNITSTLRDGRFAASIDLGASNNPAGGIAAHFSADKLSLDDRADQTNWAKVDSFKLIASRIDPDGGAITVDELSSAGVEASVNKLPTGAIEAMGFRVTAAADATPATSQSVAPATRPTQDLATMVSSALRPLPLFSLAKLDLNLTQLRVSGFTSADGAPISLANVRLKNLDPISLGGRDDANQHPLRLEVDGKIDPLVSNFAVTIQSMPQAVEPSLAVDVSATGIRGQGLTDLVPALRPTLDGSQLTSGTFHTHLDASVDYGRRGPRDFDFSRGFTALFDIKPVEFRTTPDGPVIAGVDEIRTDGIKVEPNTGNVDIKSLDITKPIGRITRETDGVHAFGFVIPIASTTQPSLAEATTNPSAPQAIASAPLVQPANEIRLDRFTVSGVDVTVEDHTTTPTTLIPLKTLDLEVRDVSNQLPWSGKSARFSMLCTSDKVPLPPRKGDAGDTEMRELFSQVTANGKIGLKPHGNQITLDGWAQTSVNGFELLGVRGISQQYGVKIGGGVFDDTNDIRFHEDGPIETKNKLVFTNLSLDEPANGPLQRAFKIPAPIDVAIGAVTDPDGSITMNIPVPIKSGTINKDDVILPATSAVGGILATAILSAPLKAAGGVGSLLGMGGNDKAKPEPPVVIKFLPGYTGLDHAQLAELAALVKRMHKDSDLELQIRHDLTAADVARASIRANPTPEDAAIVAEGLRVQKAELLARRAVLAAQARGDIGSHSAEQAAASLESLKSVDRQINECENSLDQLYDLLRPGAQTQADRRTRAASLEIGHQRLAAIKTALLVAAATDANDRIQLTNPQFDPTDSNTGGDVVITLVPKKH